jgi:mannose/fructose/N-acetylgalactosamine-specific phosphotransferase system component IID
MQNLGLLVTLLPWLRRQQVGLDQRRRFFRRHYEFFNTNPYLANFVVGGLLRLEADAQASGGPSRIRTYRDVLAPTFASLGDQLFWLGLRPALLLLAILLAVAGYPLASLAVIGAFALGQLEARRRALQTGYRLGFEIVELLGRPLWRRAIAAAQRTGMLLTGVLAGIYFARVLSSGSDSGIERAVWLALGAGIPLVLRKRLPGEALLLVTVLLAWLLGGILG